MNAPRTYGYTETRGWESDQARVLRNTYALLALSMLPTIAGAYAGVQLMPRFFAATGGTGMLTGILITLALFLVSGLLISLVQNNADSQAGIGYLALFTAFSGLMMSPLLFVVLKTAGGEKLIMLAAGTTAGIFATMALLANFVKVDHQKWVGFLSVGFWVVLLVQMIGSFGGHNVALIQAGCAMAVILFSVWIFFDIRNILVGAEGNYIRATLGIYISLYGVFVNILKLLLTFAGGSQDD